MKLRILSLLAACLMLLTVFVACQDDGEGSGTGQVTTDGYSGQYAADVPKKNYNGATFTIISYVIPPRAQTPSNAAKRGTTIHPWNNSGKHCRKEPVTTPTKGSLPTRSY